jgi:hypothetical protein
VWPDPLIPPATGLTVQYHCPSQTSRCNHRLTIPMFYSVTCLRYWSCLPTRLSFSWTSTCFQHISAPEKTASTLYPDLKHAISIPIPYMDDRGVPADETSTGPRHHILSCAGIRHNLAAYISPNGTPKMRALLAIVSCLPQPIGSLARLADRRLSTAFGAAGVSGRVSAPYL